MITLAVCMCCSAAWRHCPTTALHCYHYCKHFYFYSSSPLPLESARGILLLGCPCMGDHIRRVCSHDIL